jgi:hypothetical protein
MNAVNLEETYEMLALHIDKFEETTAPIYLAKVALLMATEIDDMEVIKKCIEDAALSLPKES